MSARIAPEPVSIAVSQVAQFVQRPSEPTRPVEPAGASSSDFNRNEAFGRRLSDGNKARPGDRPPGKDPSMLPQALFDAALIASEFKPNTAPPEPKVEPEQKVAVSDEAPRPAPQPRAETSPPAAEKEPVRSEAKEKAPDRPAPEPERPQPERLAS